jgi:hypothetical protein
MDDLVEQFQALAARMLPVQVEASRLADEQRQEADRLNQRHEELLGENVTLLKDAETLVGENTALQGRCDAHTKTVQDVNDLSEGAIKQLAVMTDRVEVNLQKITDLEGHNAKLQEKFNQSQEAAQEAASTASKFQDQCKAMLKQAQTELGDAKHACANASASARSAREELALKTDENISLQRQLTEMRDKEVCLADENRLEQPEQPHDKQQCEQPEFADEGEQNQTRNAALAEAAAKVAADFGKTWVLWVVGQDGMILKENCRVSPQLLRILLTAELVAPGYVIDLTFATSQFMAPVLLESLVKKLGCTLVEAALLIINPDVVKSFDIFRTVL